MIQVDSALKEEGLNSHMLLQVHDELVLECPESELEKTAKLVLTMMENAYNLVIPLKTEARYGHDWGDLTVLDD
jgi:DNA polymerase-1